MENPKSQAATDGSFNARMVEKKVKKSVSPISKKGIKSAVGFLKEVFPPRVPDAPASSLSTLPFTAKPA